MHLGPSVTFAADRIWFVGDMHGNYNYSDLINYNYNCINVYRSILYT